MKWTWKAHGLAILSRIPLGNKLYTTGQRIAGTNRLQLDRDLNRTYELIALCRDAGQSLTGSTVVEIGTGWRPLTAFTFALAGARRVHTIDVNPWLDAKYARETWLALEDRLDEIAAVANVDPADVRQRYQAIDPTTAATVDDFLKPVGIEYVYPGDARTTGLDDNSVDMIVSSNVLEHIPLDVQKAIHRESFRILKPGGVATHRFNPQDHYSTVDSTITNANFLQFREAEWSWYGGTGLAYHNRLRAPQYRHLFEQTGFDLAVFRERVDQRSLQAIESGELPVSEEFAQFSPQELAVDYIWVAAMKPPATDAAKTTSKPSAVVTANLNTSQGHGP